MNHEKVDATPVPLRKESVWTDNITRFHRRLIVTGFVGGFLGSLLVRVFATDLVPLAQVLLVLGLISAGSLFGWGVSRLKKQLDERQRQVRNDAYFQAYLILSAVTFAAPILITLLLLFSQGTVRALAAALLASLERSMDFVLAFANLFTFVSFLPWAILAWLEPDPITEDPFEERTLA